MVIISDTSPITSLLAINHVHLLPQLYTRITIPVGVEEELKRVESQAAEIDRLLAEKWLVVRNLQKNELFEALFKRLDRGESEAIALAVELQAELLIIDESKGRRIAKEYGLQITGLLGVLIEAKTKKLIVSVKDTMDLLITQAGFRVSKDLYELVLRTIGE